MALPAAFAFVLYLPSLGNPLVWDDEIHVPLAREMGFAQTFGNSGGEYRRPLVLLSYMAQWRTGTAGAEGLHAANVALHAGNAALLALLLLRMGLPAAVAAAAALMFVAHPLQSGSVAYVSGRTDLLAATFTLLALILAWRSPPRRVAHREPGAGDRGGRARTGDDESVAGSALEDRRGLATALLSAACVALAALSKEVGLVAGTLVALFAYLRLRRRQPASVGAALAALAVSAVCAVVVMPSAALTTSVPLALRLRCAGTAARTYAALLIWPSGLHLDRLVPTGGDGALAIALGSGAVAAAIAIRFARKPTLPGLALMCTLALYLPGSGIVPVSPAIADRLVFTPEQFLYLPLAPLCALLAAAVYRYGGTAAAVGLACVVALASVEPVLARQREFADAGTVYRSTLSHSASPRACFNLGRLQLDERRFAQAASTYRRCVELSPHDAGMRGQLAIAYQKLGRNDDARANYRRAIELDGSSPLLWSNFATLDANEGRYREAREKWQRALALDPSFAPARAALARLDRAVGAR